METTSNERRKIKPLPPLRHLNLGSFTRGLGAKPKPKLAWRKLGLLHSKHISSLNIEACRDEFTPLIQRSLQFRPLKRLEFYSRDSSKMGLTLLSDFLRKLGSKSLQKLDLKFYGSERMLLVEEDMKRVCRNMKFLTHLTGLNFEITSLTAKGTFLKPLEQALQCLSSLEQLKIRVSGWKDFSKEGVKYLGDSLNRLNTENLQSISFTILNTNVGVSEIFPNFMRNVERLSQLRRIWLKLGQSMSEAMTEEFGGPNQAQLEVFRERMGVISKLKNLEEFHFSSEGIGSKKQEIVIESVGANPNIKSLYLKLEEMGQSGFEKLGNSLKNIDALEELNLFIDTFPVSSDKRHDPMNESCFVNLILGLNRHLATLKHFKFTLNPLSRTGSKELISQGYADIGRVLADCPNMETLFLPYKDQLKSIHAMETFKAIKNMKGIKCLMLQIDLQDGVESAAVIIALKEALAAIPGVEKLYLLLINFSAFTQMHVESLLEEISKMNNLVEFVWRLRTIPQLTRESFDSTVETIKGLKALKIAQLDFEIKGLPRLEIKLADRLIIADVPGSLHFFTNNKNKIDLFKRLQEKLW